MPVKKIVPLFFVWRLSRAGSEGRPRCQVSYSLPLQCFTMLAWICIETDAQIEQNMNMKHQFGSILQTAALAQARTDRDTAES